MAIRSRAVAVVVSVAAVAVLDAATPIKIATIAPDNSVYVKALREMGEAWKKRTEGRITAVVYPGGDNTEEGMLRDMRPAFRKYQAAQLSAITLGNLDDAFNVFGLPMFFDSYEEADRVLEKLRPQLEGRLERRGYKPLNWAYVGWVHVFSTRPIKTVDDLKHLKLYTSAGDDRLAKWYKANGFTAVVLEATSMLPALKTGMIEAIPSPPLIAQLLTWYRSAPYMMDLGFAPLLGSTVMSLDCWNRLTPGDQEIVLDEARKAGERLREQVPRLDREAIEAMKKSGLTVTVVDRAVWRRVAEELAEGMRKDGVVPGDVYDIAKRERDAVRAGK